MGVGAPVYTRHRPERNLLYQIVEEYYPAFESRLASQGRALPVYVQCEFEDYLRCGRLEHGFLRVICDSCHAEHLVAFSCTNSRRLGERRGYCPSCGARRMAESAVRFQPIDARRGQSAIWQCRGRVQYFIYSCSEICPDTQTKIIWK